MRISHPTHLITSLVSGPKMDIGVSGNIYILNGVYQCSAVSDNTQSTTSDSGNCFMLDSVEERNTLVMCF